MGKTYQPMWRIKQQADPRVLELYVYGVVERETYVDDDSWWGGHWEEAETSANHFRDVLEAHPDVTQINVYIDSPGGYVNEGVTIYNQLRRHPAHKTVYVDGFACSIASVIAMAGDEVIMGPNTMMMIHNVATETYGNADQLRKTADTLDVMNDASRQAYLDKAGDKLPEDELEQMMNEETWLTAAQCVDLGLADRISRRDGVSEPDTATVLAGASQRLAQQMAQYRGMRQALKEMMSCTAVPQPSAHGEPDVPPEPGIDPQQTVTSTPNAILALFGKKLKEEAK